jgi:RNA polymerase sigma factor (sigma-70 family)
MSPEPTVFVVDDDEGVRKSLRWLVGSIHLRVATFESPQEFLDGYDARVPGCLVLDVCLPAASGLELQQHLLDSQIRLPVIIITGHGDVSTAIRAFRARAFDFFEKPFDGQHLLLRIREAIALDTETRATCAVRTSLRDRLERLTPRERQVLSLVVAGKSSKEIAVHLGVSVNTVENHRARMMLKMCAESVAHLVRMVSVSGLDSEIV